MKTKRLTELGLLTALALILFIIEIRLPNLVPVPGGEAGTGQYHNGICGLSL